jgi:hypothetical protein
MRWPLGPEILDELGEDGARALLDMPGATMDAMKADVANGKARIEFVGGDGEIEDEDGKAKGNGLTLSEMELVITPYSMERPSESQRQAKLRTVIELATVLPQAMAAAPWLFSNGKLLQWISENSSVREFTSFVDYEEFGEFVGFEMQLRALGAAGPSVQGPGGRAQGASKPPARIQAGPSASAQPKTPWGGQASRAGNKPEQQSQGTPKPMLSIGGAA